MGFVSGRPGVHVDIDLHLNASLVKCQRTNRKVRTRILMKVLSRYNFFRATLSKCLIKLKRSFKNLFPKILLRNPLLYCFTHFLALSIIRALTKSTKKANFFWKTFQKFKVSSHTLIVENRPLSLEKKQKWLWRKTTTIFLPTMQCKFWRNMFISNILHLGLLRLRPRENISNWWFWRKRSLLLREKSKLFGLIGNFSPSAFWCNEPVTEWFL